MGLQHSTYLGYGFEIPATTDFEALDTALADQPDDRRIEHTYLGDFDRLFLLAHSQEIEACDFASVTPEAFTRYEIPAWTAALHDMAVRLGHPDHPLPTWLVLHGHS